MIPSYIEVYSRLRIPYEQLDSLTEAHRNEFRKYLFFFLGSLFTTVCFWFVAYNAFVSVVWLGFVFIFILLVSIFLLISKWTKHDVEYKTLFKQSVVGPLASNIVELTELPNADESYEQYCEYLPNQKISKTWIQLSELFKDDIDDMYGEDYFKGKLGKTEFQMSELKLTKDETSVDAKGNASKTTVTIFDGALFVADFKKDFSGLTTVESNIIKADNGFKKIAGKLFNGAGSTVNRSITRKILLEDEAFNRSFRVRTSNEIEARYILSSKMMERILAFYEKHPYQIWISFHKSYMFIAFHSNRNFFDEGITKINGRYNVEGIYDDIAFFVGMIEEFDLNTRIWSKV